MRQIKLLLLVFLALASFVFGQANGKLQIHFIDVGQGDGAILISPQGQVAVFDVGEDLVSQACDKPASYFGQLGLVISHYHEDHIGLRAFAREPGSTGPHKRSKFCAIGGTSAASTARNHRF